MTGSDVDTLSPEGRAYERVTMLESEEKTLQGEIDEIEKNIRTAYDDKSDGFRKNPFTGVIYYIGTDKAMKDAFKRLAELKEEKKV